MIRIHIESGAHLDLCRVGAHLHQSVLDALETHDASLIYLALQSYFHHRNGNGVRDRCRFCGRWTSEQMTEFSAIAKIINALELAKANELGCDLTYFDVLELLGYIKDMKATVVEQAERTKKGSEK